MCFMLRIVPTFLIYFVAGGASLSVRCANLHYHKMWIRLCPSQRLLFGVEITIDDYGVALSRTSPAQPRSFAIHYGRSTVYGYTLRIMKDNFAAIRNLLWINCTVPVAQPCAVPSRIRA